MNRRFLLKKVVAAIAAAAFPPVPVIMWSGTAIANPREHRIETGDFKFSPTRVEVSVGDTITWVNHDITPHTATAVDGSWDTGELVKGAEASIAVTADMGSGYFCAFHPMMKAQLSITPIDQ